VSALLYIIFRGGFESFLPGVFGHLPIFFLFLSSSFVLESRVFSEDFGYLQAFFQ